MPPATNVGPRATNYDWTARLCAILGRVGCQKSDVGAKQPHSNHPSKPLDRTTRGTQLGRHIRATRPKQAARRTEYAELRVCEPRVARMGLGQVARLGLGNGRVGDYGAGSRTGCEAWV